MVCAAGLWPAGRASAQDTQTRPVTGTVTRAAGQPIEYATVLVKGTARGTQTDAAGAFRLVVPAGPLTLTARAIGFLPKDVPLGAADNTVTINMVEDPAKLEQIVVTGVATGVSKRSAATSTEILGAELTRGPATTVDQALQGKVPSANIQTNSGAPGGGVQVQIRGVNTAIGATDPVFVVDGVLYSNAQVPTGLYSVTQSGTVSGSGPAQDDASNRLADLNPADIETIEVLPSAAASSIYGSKAANGVVVITTKRGKAGKTVANITQRVGESALLRGPGTRRYDLPTALSQFSSDSAIILGIAAANGGKLPFYDHLQEIAGQKPINYETLLDLSGGTPNTRYYISGGIASEGGIMRNSDATRQALRVNLDQRLAPKLEANFTSSFAHSVANRGVANNDNSGASVPYAIAYIPGFLNIQPVNGIYPHLPITYKGSNPLQTLQYTTDRENINHFTGGGHSTYQALTSDHHSLQLVAGGGIDYFNDNATVIAPAFLYFQANQAQPGTSTLGGGNSRQYNWNLNAIHTYTVDVIKATTSVGSSFEDRELDLSRSSTFGLGGATRNIDQGVTVNPFELNSHERTLSFYGQEQLTGLSDRALLEIGVRGERSSANGNANKYFFYPKIAGSYRLPQFLPAGTEIKLRAAYGVTGNQPLFGQKFTLLNCSPIGGVVGCGVGNSAGVNNTFGDANIRPETTREVEFGTDVTSWNGRADLEVTFFHRRTSDLFLPRTPAPSTGFGTLIANGGEFQNEGLEIAGTITPWQTGNSSWTFQTSFSSLHNTVVSLPFPSFRPSTAGFGLAFGEFLVQPGRPITQLIGQIGYDTTNGKFIVGYMGQLNPDYRWSFTNTVNLGRFTVAALLDWQKGGVEENQTLSLYDCNNLAPDGSTPAGIARENACNAGPPIGGIATPFVQSTTFLKLRELRVAYDLPIGAARSFFGSEGVTLSASGRNLFVVTNYFGYDPEVSNYGKQAITRGVDLGQYPPSRRFLFSVTARF